MSDATPVLAEPPSNERAPRRHSSEELFALLYDELRRLAASKIAKEAPGQTLQATSRTLAFRA